MSNENPSAATAHERREHRWRVMPSGTWSQWYPCGPECGSVDEYINAEYEHRLAAAAQEPPKPRRNLLLEAFKAEKNIAPFADPFDAFEAGWKRAEADVQPQLDRLKRAEAENTALKIHLKLHGCESLNDVVSEQAHATPAKGGDASCNRVPATQAATADPTAISNSVGPTPTPAQPEERCGYVYPSYGQCPYRRDFHIAGTSPTEHPGPGMALHPFQPAAATVQEKERLQWDDLDPHGPAVKCKDHGETNCQRCVVHEQEPPKPRRWVLDRPDDDVSEDRIYSGPELLPGQEIPVLAEADVQPQLDRLKRVEAVMPVVVGGRWVLWDDLQRALKEKP